jgi:hypothetical protein
MSGKCTQPHCIMSQLAGKCTQPHCIMSQLAGKCTQPHSIMSQLAGKCTQPHCIMSQLAIKCTQPHCIMSQLAGKCTQPHCIMSQLAGTCTQPHLYQELILNRCPGKNNRKSITAAYWCTWYKEIICVLLYPFNLEEVCFRFRTWNGQLQGQAPELGQIYFLSISVDYTYCEWSGHGTVLMENWCVNPRSYKICHLK